LSAAEAGNKNAQYMAGNLYNDGRGVPQSVEMAVKYWRLAAGQGVPEAQGSLGVMYFNGQGAPKDLLRAYMWLGAAASSPNSVLAQKAKQFQDTVGAQMQPDQLNEARGKAERCIASKFMICN
jgi:TPR repeat protein